MTTRSARVTDLLRAWGKGDEDALGQLVPIVEGELRRLARIHMRRERQGHTLQPTALVNEVYLRLAGNEGMEWKNRAQFFAMAATIMRRILVDYARAHNAEKRGSGLFGSERCEVVGTASGHFRPGVLRAVLQLIAVASP